MRLVYLPTNQQKKINPNVGKSTIDGWYEHVIIPQKNGEVGLLS